MAADGKIPVYLAASFKGVPFNVETSADEFGRRGEVYEYPLGERTGYKDLGRKARRFKVEGYLIGGDQIAKTNAMAGAAESPEPGMLIHPMFGPQLVACVTLTSSADYKKEKRRTKLTFDFVEAMTSMAPFLVGVAISAMFTAGSAAVSASMVSAQWLPTAAATAASMRMSLSLSSKIAPAADEDSFDAMSMLQRNVQAGPVAQPSALVHMPVDTASAAYVTFDAIVGPVDNGTATVRRIHEDAMVRLRSWNADVVAEADGSAPIESLIVSSRLAMIRDYALSAAQTKYSTVRDALVDLDFVMSVYDDEEVIAVKRCDDPLVTAIRKARATAAHTILTQNIALPGISESSTNGVWPSLVVAHKLYFDGTRYADVESYNPRLSPFFIGRTVIAPSA